MNSKLIFSIFHIFIATEVLRGVDSFQCPEKFGHFHDTTDCSKYYVCNHGRSLMKTCEEGLLFSTSLKTCDWPRNVQCDRGGKRVNTRRNPDLKKTSFQRQRAEFEENNQLGPSSEELPNEPNYSADFRHSEKPILRQPMLNGRPPINKVSWLTPGTPKWQQNVSPKQLPPNSQSRGPVVTNRSPKVKPIAAPPTVDPKDSSLKVKEDDPNSEYEYDIPDYYDYEGESPIRNPRQPVVESATPKPKAADLRQKAPSVKRIGWLPEDPDSDRMNEYHWTPNEGEEYSKDKPRVPNEAFVKMKDFRNVEKQLAEDNSPNVGPEPEDDDDYNDYYEDDHPPDEEEDYHNHPHNEEEETPPPNENEQEHPNEREHPDEQPAENEDEHEPEHPPPEHDSREPPPNRVRYDDEEEVRQQPRIRPPVRPPVRPLARPQTRQRVPIPPPQPNHLNSRPGAIPLPHSAHNPYPNIGGGEPFARIKSTLPSDDISGLRSVANKYESVPKAITSATSAGDTADHLTRPVIKTNIHFKNNNSPYLRPVLDDPEQNKGRLIKSVPRFEANPKRRVVVRKVIKQNRQPLKASAEQIESVTPSVYQLLDDYREGLPTDALLKHRKTAQAFRDSIIDNYMNNEKPNYILNDKDFDSKTYTVPIINGETDDNLSDDIRDFDQDFSTTTENSGQNNGQNNENNEQKHKKLSSDRNSVKIIETKTNYKNKTTEKPIKNRTDTQFMNTDAIVKQQRAQDSVSHSLTTVSPPVTKNPELKPTKKPMNFEVAPFDDYKEPKRSIHSPIPTRFGFKQSAVIPTIGTTVRPTRRSTPKPTFKPKIRIKTPRPKPREQPKTERPAPILPPIPPPRPMPKPVNKQVAKPKPIPKKTDEWYQTVNYEPKSSEQDIQYIKAHKCDGSYCKPPDCRCGGLDIPGALPLKQTPQIVLLTFDDSVNDLNWDIYDELFNSGRNNPNGCPILATFYVSHEWTDYAQVQTLYSKGHEIASHSITHSFGEKFSKELWLKEIAGQRELLSRYGGVKESDVRGMRAPFLQTGGNTMFEMLYEANFTYDSSLPIYQINPPYYPYTLDYAINHECMITPCPTKSFPGLWEVGMVMWEDLRNGRCSMADACFNPKDEQGVYEMVKKNFDRHYTTNRAPFGIYFHARWFLTDINRKGFLKFLDEMNGMNDVFFVTNSQMIEWMRSPTPLNKIENFKPWKCGSNNDRPHECSRPNECKVKLKSETRVLKTCQPCPKTYPWRGNNGLKFEN